MSQSLAMLSWTASAYDLTRLWHYRASTGRYRGDTVRPRKPIIH